MWAPVHTLPMPSITLRLDVDASAKLGHDFSDKNVNTAKAKYQ